MERFGVHLVKKIIKTLLKGCFVVINFFKRSFFGENELIVYYSLEVCPPSFDFCTLLVAAEVECKKRGLKRIQVILEIDFEKHKGAYGIFQDVSGLKWRLDNLVIPLIRLFPIVRSFRVVMNTRQAIKAIGPTINVYPYHPLFPGEFNFLQLHESLFNHFPESLGSWGVQPSNAGKRYVNSWVQNNAGGKKLVVITVRNSSYAVKRNNKLAEWKKFIDSCDQKEFYFVFVLDSDTVFEGIPKEISGCNFFNEACWNIGIRAALYELAYLNLSTHSGPVMLCYFNQKCKVVLFKVYVEGEPTACKELIKKIGFRGNQFPWKNPFQVIVWEEDDLEVLKKEFKKMCDRIEKNEQSESSVSQTQVLD